MITSILSAKLSNQPGITELFFANTKIGWVQRKANGKYIAHSCMSGKIYYGKKIMDVCLPLEKELDCKQNAS